MAINRGWNARGLTFVEVMVVLAISFLLLMGVIGLHRITTRLLEQGVTRLELQKEALASFRLVIRMVKQADGRSIVIRNEPAGQPWSRIEFRKMNEPDLYTFYQQGEEFYFQKGLDLKKLSAHVKRASFIYPRYPLDKGVLQISLSFVKGTGSRQQTYTVGDTVNLLNPSVRNLDKGI